MQQGRTIRLEHIRQSRKRPGLQPQHLKCIDLLAKDLHLGTLDGEVVVGSDAFTFYPSSMANIPTKVKADVGTAGSVGLILQAVLPCLLFAPRSTALTLKGGTDVSRAPSSE